MKKQHISLNEQFGKARSLIHKLQRYSLVAFVIFVAVIYGFIVLRISSLNSAPPSSTQVSQEVTASHAPHIDAAVVQQLESLQDNSVSVHALFDQARSNPFQ